MMKIEYWNTNVIHTHTTQFGLSQHRPTQCKRTFIYKIKVTSKKCHALSMKFCLFSQLLVIYISESALLPCLNSLQQPTCVWTDGTDSKILPVTTPTDSDVHVIPSEGGLHVLTLSSGCLLAHCPVELCLLLSPPNCDWFLCWIREIIGSSFSISLGVWH